MKFKPIYIFHIIMLIILIYPMVHIRKGVSVTCCCPCDNINSSYSLGKDNTYQDTFLSVIYSPIIVPTLYFSELLLKKYSNKYGVEVYESANIVLYAQFCLDNQKNEKKKLKRKVTNYYDSYNFSSLYFFITLNIVVSYIIWVYIISKLKKYKTARGVLLGVLISLLAYIYFMYIMTIESMDSIPYIQYMEQYSKNKETSFVIEWDEINKN